MTTKKLQWSVVLAVFLSFMGTAVAAQATETVVPDSQQSSVSTNLGLYGGDNWDIAVDGDYVYTIASGTPNGFFYSTDAGATWHQPSGTNDFGSGQSVEVDHATGTVYAGLGGDIYQSTDHGATLTLLKENTGSPMVVTSDAIIGGWNSEVSVSTDAGATWASVAVNETGYVSSLAASKTPGTFYVTMRDSETGDGALYVSTDYGATWTPVPVLVDSVESNAFTTVRTNPYDENDLAVGDDHDVYLSTDAGVTFTEITNAPAACNAIATWTSTGRLYACSSYSDDGGATWTEMDFTDIVRGPGRAIEVNSADEQVIYGDSMSGVTKSVDGGVTWENSYQGITGVNVLAISTTADKSVAWTSSTNGLAKSMDFNSGTPTWEFPILPCAPGRCDPSGIGESVWVKPDDANIVLAGSIGGYIFRSADAGETWNLADIPSIDDPKFIDSDSGMSFLRPYKFVSDPNDSTVIYAVLSGTEIGAVIKSVDSGATWEDLAIPDDAPARSLAISSTGVVYVGTGFQGSTLKGMYVYADSVWTLSTDIPSDLDVSTIVIDSENESVMYATTIADGVVGGDGLYTSSDAGVTWTEITGIGEYYNFGTLTVQTSTTPNTLYLACRDNDWHGILLKSSNQGQTWGVLYTGLRSETYNTLVFDGLVAGSTKGLFSMKSKAQFKSFVKSSTADDGSTQLSARLRDKTTKKILKHKTVKLYQKKSGHWVFVAKAKTSMKGKISFSVKPLKTRAYRLTWKPGPQFLEEYARSVSKIVRVTVE